MTPDQARSLANDVACAIATLQAVQDELKTVYPDSDIETSGGNQPKQEAVPAKPTVTLEQVRSVLADKSRAGFTAQVRELLLKHGAAKLSDIDPAEYQALLEEAEGLTDG